MLGLDRKAVKAEREGERERERDGEIFFKNCGLCYSHLDSDSELEEVVSLSNLGLHTVRPVSTTVTKSKQNYFKVKM